MNIKKYFWDYNPKAVKEISEIIKNPEHPKYASTMKKLLSRCDKPKEIFSVIDKDVFINSWSKIKKYWQKTAHSLDFFYWWQSIYENIAKVPLKEKPAKKLIEIGKKIKNIRIEKGISQQELSKLTGITQADISRIERGFTNFKIMRLLKILKILKIDNLEI